MASSGKCTSCGAGLEAVGKKGRINCPFCGTLNILDNRPPLPGNMFCAICGCENPINAEHCSECGADLYFTCPKCGTRNTADSIHCSKCGAHIQTELQAKKVADSQRQAMYIQQQAVLAQQKAKQARTMRAIFIPLGILLMVIVILIIGAVGKANREWDQEMNAYYATKTEEYALKTTTAQANYDNYPFVWTSADGLLQFRLHPKIQSGNGEIYFSTTIINNTEDRCSILDTSVYAFDEDGRMYQNKYASNTNMTTYIEAKGKNSISDFLTPQLSTNSETLTFIYPDFCGYSNIRISVDLTSSEITIEQ